MKYFALYLLLFTATLTASRGAETPPLLSVKIAWPAEGRWTDKPDERQLVYPNYTDWIPAHFPVIVTNISDQPQRIYRERYQFSFEITDEAGKTHKAEKMWFNNGKSLDYWWTLSPGECVVLDVYYDKGDWTGFPKPPSGESQTVTMRAVFELEPFGRIVSEPQKIVFTNYQDKPKKH